MDQQMNVIQKLEIVLIEGVHFWNTHEYFQEMAQTISIFNLFLGTNERVEVIKQQLKKNKTSIQSLYICKCKQYETIYVLEHRNLDQSFVEFYFSERCRYIEKEQTYGVRISLKIQVYMPVDQAAKNLLKINIQKNNSQKYIQILFPQLAKLHKSSYIIKQNYCKFSKVNQIVYPFQRYQSIKQYDKEGMILLINQKNMSQTEFFKGIIEEVTRGGKHISKIIGHSSSLLLMFLFDSSGKYDQTIGNALIHKNISTMKKINKIDNQEQLSNLKEIFLKVFKEQNILDHDFAYFLVDNILTDQFSKKFIEVIILYYQIFQNIEISREQIERAISSKFYIEQQQNCQYVNHFSSIFKYIEFHHRTHYQDILHRISSVFHHKQTSIEEFTLQDLYNYNQIQFTFVAFDIQDKIIRFFNHYTTPLMPIRAIISLTQLLPIPYKSITWQQSWGRYKIHYKNTLKQINITSHQIIDSRFVVECPLDLIQSPIIRQCYFTSSELNPQIHAISSTRIKFNELNHIEELKTTLKEMKNNAVESIPKLRLLWKIITTKKLIDVDLDNIQSFSQIRILQKILKMDETYKEYLQNLNRQAYDEIHVKTRMAIYNKTSPSAEEMVNNIRSLQHTLINFQQSSGEIVEKNEKDLNQSIMALEKIFKKVIVTNQQIQFSLSVFSNILKSYRINGKYKYRQLITKINEIMDQNDAFYCLQDIKTVINTVINMFKLCELKNRQSFIQSQILNVTGTFKKQNRESTEKYQNYPLQIESIKQSLKIFSRIIQNYKNQEQQSINIQFLRCQYQKLLFKLSYKIYNCFEGKKEAHQIKKMYYQIFMKTPRIYYMEQIANKQFFLEYQIKRLIKSSSKLHVVLSGKPNVLQHQASQLLQLRQLLRDNKNIKVTSVTATNHHSLLAMLFCLQTKRYDLLQDIMGLQHLIKVNEIKINQQSINIINFLMGDKHEEYKVYSITQKKRDSQLRMKLIRKYQNIYMALTKLQDLYKMNNQFYKISDVYDLLQKFDITEQDVDMLFKENIIIKYVQGLLSTEEQIKKVKELLLDNDEMLRQKIFLNKVGIKFILRLLFRAPQKQDNWMKIHTSTYHSLSIYKAYLQNIFKKYNLKQDLSLLEFNETNCHLIQLNFVLINQSSLKYQLINSKTQPHLKLIDLLLASISLPIEFSTFPLPTINIKDPSILQTIIQKLQHKITSRLQENYYWSNYSLNSCPFSFINSEGEQLIRFEILTQFDEPFIQRSSRISLSQTNQVKDTAIINHSQKEIQNDKLKGTDLISLWWTKSKKLIPQIKKILFGNAENSPFMKYYYFLQNFSYEYLSQDFQKKSLINLYKSSDLFLTYGKIIGNSILLFNNQLQRISFLLIKTSQNFNLQLINSAKSKGILIQIDSKVQRQIFKVQLQKRDQLQINIYLFNIITISKLSITIDIKEMKNGNNFFEVVFEEQNQKYLATINELIIEDKTQRKQILQFKYEQTRKMFTICSVCRLIVINNQKIQKQRGKCHICDKKTIKNKILCLFIQDQQELQKEEDKNISIHKQSLKQQQNKTHSSWCCACLSRR